MGGVMDGIRARTSWIFDMDGTLTVPIHDFDALRERLGLPSGAAILEAIAESDPARRAWLESEVEAWEGELALRAQPQPDAVALLESLAAEGRRLAVLTRNTRPHALTTLRACGLEAFFESDCILGREDAEPKPHPAGVRKILAHWGVDGAEAVVVGDWVHDIRAGARAGAATVLIHRPGRKSAPWFAEADLVVDDLTVLLGAMPLSQRIEKDRAAE